MDSKDLHPLEEFTVDVAVCLGELIAEILMPQNGTIQKSCGVNSDKLLVLSGRNGYWFKEMYRVSHSKE